MRLHYSIIFIHDYDDVNVARLLDKLSSIGDTQKWEKELYKYLLQWDMIENRYDESVEPFYGTSDTVVQFENYILSYNTRLGYVALSVYEEEE